MPDETEQLTIDVNDKEAVSALLYPAAKKIRAGLTALLGHGAGANQLSGFMRMFARGLAERGLDVMTFNFIYMEQGRSVPDQKPKLESCFRAAIEAIAKHRKLKTNRLVVGGKSMGGRIASQVVAARKQAPLALDVSGLVFLGYPLHPPGNPAKLRVEHLEQIQKPMLFVQGTRDALGTPEEIQPFVKNLRPPAKIYAIEGGDHSFKAPKKFGLDQPQVYENAMDEIVRWAATI
ncbi:MAG TPA: alpha/beta family hydrolase [Pyrinomonadaceae bacterium]|jgi:predicted alpha/beta-hydrolase family hydrolase|nr:alpha/beta family hydrolase [Pyrinomonadaceae bacterium]